MLTNHTVCCIWCNTDILSQMYTIILYLQSFPIIFLYILGLNLHLYNRTQQPVTCLTRYLFDCLLVVRRPPYTLYYSRRTRYTTTAVQCVWRPSYHQQKYVKGVPLPHKDIGIMLKNKIKYIITGIKYNIWELIL